MAKLKDATYKMVYFPGTDSYIGIAWNYDHAVLISTRDWESYRLAKQALVADCDAANVRLTWFDGEYRYDANSGQLFSQLDGGDIQ